MEVYDFGFYSQALSKIARGFDLDLSDVREMLERRLIDPDRLRALYAAIEGELFRFPSVDPASLRKKLDGALG